MNDLTKPKNPILFLGIGFNLIPKWQQKIGINPVWYSHNISKTQHYDNFLNFNRGVEGRPAGAG